MQRGTYLLSFVLFGCASGAPGDEYWTCEQRIECDGQLTVEDDLHTCLSDDGPSIDERTAAFDSECAQGCVCDTQCGPMGVSCDEARYGDPPPRNPPTTSSHDEYSSSSSDDNLWALLLLVIAYGG